MPDKAHHGCIGRVVHVGDGEVMTQCASGVSRTKADSWWSQRLRKRLYDYRVALSAEWSESTVHPAFSVGRGRPASAGQCGVSSAWLLHQLPLPLRSRARYCIGDIRVHSQTLPSHCWIEVGRAGSSGRWVVDLTCDQYELLSDRAFICDRHDRLADLEIEYRAMVRLSAGELRADPVWRRTQVLAKGMTRSFDRSSVLDAFAAWLFGR